MRDNAKILEENCDLWKTNIINYIVAHSIIIVLFLSKKTISIDFNLNLLIQAFMIIGYVGVFQCIDCRFVLRLY